MKTGKNELSRTFLKNTLLTSLLQFKLQQKIPNWMENHLRMTKEKLLKKLNYDLKKHHVYARKSKLLQEAGNHLKMTKEEPLKKLYYDLKNAAAYTGKFKLFQEEKKHDSNISIEDAEECLKSQLTYTLHKCLNFNTRPVLVHEIDEQ